MADPERTTARIDLSAGRLEAFSDAVIAVIITILALELRPPAGTSWPDLKAVLPTFAVYVLSFTFIAIYWNNHHHLLRATTRISGAVMWANMALLFCLSLIPFATAWIQEAYHEEQDPSWPAAFFGIVALAAALTYYILVRAIIRANGPSSLVGTAVHADLKGKISLVLYVTGTGLAFVNVWIAYATYVAVAVMWLVPDRRFTHEHDANGERAS
jgi:uncharacterized membrane protein